MTLRDEVLRFDPTLPVARASTPPASWYTSRAFHDLERRAVFADSWQAVALTHQLAEPGSFVSGCFAGEPWVIVRDDDTLRAFANVCRHKAAPVAEGAGTATELRCRYHGWRYRLDGRLATAPRIGGIQDFDREALGLRPMSVEVWGPFVLLNPTPDAAPFAPTVPELDAALRASGWDQLTYAGSRTWRVRCNWKVFVDNYLDGGYHIANMHPSLDDQLDMGSYDTRLYARSSVQTSDAADGVDRIGGGAIYGWVYPNLMINRYGDALDTNWVIPHGPDDIEVRFHWWFAHTDAEAIAASIAQSGVTQQEDIVVSEWVQTGMGSRAFDTGRYAPRVEHGEHHFHRLLAADLRSALGIGPSA
jgi:choline monooxygenase